MSVNKFALAGLYLGSMVLAYGCGASQMKQDLSKVSGELKTPVVETYGSLNQDQTYECREYMIKVNGKTTVEDSYEAGTVFVVMAADRKSFISKTGAEVAADLQGENNGIYFYKSASGDDYIKFGEGRLVRESSFERYVGDQRVESKVVANCYLQK